MFLGTEYPICLHWTVYYLSALEDLPLVTSFAV